MVQMSSNPGSVRSPIIAAPGAGSQHSPGSNPKPRRLSSIWPTREPYLIEKRPTFGQWAKVSWSDLLTIFLVGAVTFPTYYLAQPIGTRIFPLDVSADNGDLSPNSASDIPPNFAYPAQPQTVSNWLIALVAISIPILLILLVHCRTRSFWDLNNAILGFVYALLISSAFQATTKAFVGGLRPNFYDVCQPHPEHAMCEGNKTGLNGIGFRKDMWTMDVCTTTNARGLRNAMQGFPSGHSTTMVAAMVYLSLFLNAKLKVFANYQTPLWKLIAIVLPILGAVLLCGTLIIDHTHSWYDIVGGATIGGLMALAAFRMVYASVFDWRINHMPLHRNMPFDGGARPKLAATSRAGWRSPVRKQEKGKGRRNDGTLTPDMGGDGTADNPIAMVNIPSHASP